MPIYPYRCDKCGNKWEAVHGVSERDNESCCGKPAIREIAKTFGRPVILEGYNEGLGAYVTGPKQKAKIMQEKNLDYA
jgi:putative FmdB family regulatory protein